MNNYWISWSSKSTDDFELWSPWWYTGETFDGETRTVVAAVRAYSEDDAKTRILAAHDEPPKNIEWRFCELKPDDWSPFNGRFRLAPWMKWEEE